MVLERVGGKRERSERSVDERKKSKGIFFFFFEPHCPRSWPRLASLTALEAAVETSASSANLNEARRGAAWGLARRGKMDEAAERRRRWWSLFGARSLALAFDSKETEDFARRRHHVSVFLPARPSPRPPRRTFAPRRPPSRARRRRWRRSRTTNAASCSAPNSRRRRPLAGACCRWRSPYGESRREGREETGRNREAEEGKERRKEVDGMEEVELCSFFSLFGLCFSTPTSQPRPAKERKRKRRDAVGRLARAQRK